MPDIGRHAVAVTRAQKHTPATARAVRRSKTLPGNPGGDAPTNTRLRFAFVELEQSGALAGARSKKLSMRVDPGLIEAARRRAGAQAYAATPA
jgi:hypothetical protein